MERDDRKKNKVIDLMSEIKKRKNDSNDDKNISISARDNVIIGDNNNIYSSPPTIKKEIVVTPGHDTITEEQKSRLQQLVADIGELEINTRRQKKPPYQKIWTSLNRAMKVSSYHMIPLEKFPLAEHYLQKWIGRLSSSKTAKKKYGEDIRNRHIKYIQTNMRLLDAEKIIRTYISNKFDVSSLSSLTNEELEKTYRYVAGLKKRLSKD